MAKKTGVDNSASIILLKAEAEPHKIVAVSAKLISRKHENKLRNHI
jgi:hypothetical protein